MKDALFNDKYKALNKEQKLAVDTIEGPVMVIAGPGTGKTTILTLRIANILRQTDTPASGILALTFTDSGVKSMKRKLREIVGSRADEVRIHTFHSFAGSVFSEFSDHFPSLFRTKQITDIEAEDLVREILKKDIYHKLRPFGEPDYYLGKILKAISDCKKENTDPEKVSAFAKDEIERIKKDKDSISSRGPTKGELKADALKKIEKCERTIVFSDVFKEYEKHKKSEKLLDYDDLLLELIHALDTDKLLLQLLQEKFLYVHIDEHQDTNDSQNFIVMKLVDFFDTPNIFVVGDEKQAIYRFQGASVENFLKFKKIWKDMKTISLKSNYRSHQAILSSTFKMIENNYDEDEHTDLRVPLISSAKNERPIDIISSPDEHTQDEFVIKRLKEITSENKDDTIALIMRKNREVEHFLAVCERANITVSAERGIDIFSHPLGELYFDILEFLVDPTNTEAFANTLARGLWGVSFENSISIINRLRSGQTEDLKNINGLEVLNSEINNSGVIRFFILVAELSGFSKLVTEPLSSEVWRTIIDLTKDIAERSSIDSPKIAIKELLNYRKTAESKSIKLGSGSLDAKIHIMTAHSSKGLEYDYVILPSCTEESWMNLRFGSSFIFPFQKEEGDEIKDSRRLFYVAMTRAKKHVEVIIPDENSGGRELTKLRFVDELDDKYLKNIRLDKIKDRPLHINLGDITEKRKLESIEYAKRRLVENGLSVTALNHFIDCPKVFFYKSILKLPEAPSPTSEKGIAMHKALSLVWREEDRSKKSIQNIIKKVSEEYFKKSLLQKFEKDIVLDEIISYSETVAKELENYFAFKGQVFVEKWEEKDFETLVQNKEVSIKLHGQLDSILIDDKSAKIYDYKTTEVKSVNEIMGETKNSDGNYFRQLVFYKHLLQDNHNYKDKDLIPSLIFVKPNKKGECPTVTLPITEEDISNLKKEIDLLVKSVWSGEFLDKDCGKGDCVYCKIK